MLPVARDARGHGHKRLVSALSSQPILFFVLFKRHPPSSHPSTPYTIWAWWTLPTGLEGDLVSPPPPKLGDRRWPMGCETDQVQWGFAMARPV